MLFLATMRLSEYLRQSGIKQGAFAEAIGVTQGRVSQLLNGELPSFDRALDLIRRIEAATNGMVTASDFRSSDSEVAE